MDVLRSMAVASIAELVLIGSFVPVEEDSADVTRKHRRAHTRGHVQTLTAERLDYPVIANWSTTPTPAEPEQA